MGRQSGFIAMMASMASGIVDCCLIPEIKFSLAKLNTHIEDVILKKGHCVICVAEGAGQVCEASGRRLCLMPCAHVPHQSLMLAVQDMIKGVSGQDASGNPILGDVGKFLAKEVHRSNLHGSCDTNNPK
jgi:6-phosphofructokinase 1